MIRGLTHNEEDILGVLTTEVTGHRQGNKQLASYYDGTHRVQRIGVAVPRTLSDIGVVSGWPATVVDTYGDLLRMDGFISPDYGEEMRLVTRRFNVPLRVSEAILDMLIFGLGLLAVEPDPHGVFRLRSVSPLSGSLLWDDATNGPVAGYRRSGVNSEGVYREVLYLQGEVIVISKDSTDVGKVRSVERHPVPGGGFPMFRLRNRLRTSHWSGQSEITPAVRYLTDAAARTLENMEYNSEFYASPQRWATGASPEDFGYDPEGMTEFDRVEMGWRTSIGKMLVINGDEDDPKQPSVGQFASSPPTPFIEQVRAYSQLIASESKIPAQYFGFMTENPPSGDSIRVWKEQLIRASEIKTELMNPDLLELARVLVQVSDLDQDVDIEDLVDGLEVDWRDPATASKAADADWALKLLTSGVLAPDSEVLLKNLHFSAADRLQIEQENRSKRLSQLAKVLEASSTEEQSHEDTPTKGAEDSAPSPRENASEDAKEARQMDVQRPWTSITPVVDSIARKAIEDLNSRARVIPDLTADPYRQKELLRQMVRETIDSYGTAVSDATMVWLEEQEDHMGMRPVEWKPRRVDSHQVEARMAHDFAPLFFEEQGYNRALNSMGFIVADELYSRQRKNAEHTAWKGGGSWARVAHPGACAFCTLLASRGFDYTSRSTAGGGYSGAHFHDHCRCLVICRKRGHVELPESTIRAQKIYKKAHDEVGSTEPDVLLRAMRQVGDLSK